MKNAKRIKKSLAKRILGFVLRLLDAPSYWPPKYKGGKRGN